MFHVKQYIVRREARHMNLTIREARPEDYISIYELIKNELGYQQLDYDKLLARLEIMEQDDKHLTVVAITGGSVAGFVGFLRGIAYNIDGEWITIIAFAVLEELQNKGIGSQLLKWVEDYALDRNIRVFEVSSNMRRLDAHAFYEKNGYTRTSYSFKKTL